MKKTNKRASGFTLVEILLVMVIVSAMFYLLSNFIQQKILQFKMNRIAADMQQIQGAELAYYLAYGQWATSVSCLQGSGCTNTIAYLPSRTFFNPISGNSYTIQGAAGQLSVITTFASGAPKSFSFATFLAGKLPTAYIADQSGLTVACTATSTGCQVVASVPVPPTQNTNNTTAVNFGSVYHNGACVPVPVCPSSGNVGSMLASIAVVPNSVTGANNAPSPTAPTGGCNPTTQSGCSVQAYPLTSYGAFATPPATVDGSTTNGPYSCESANSGSPVAAPCYASYNSSGAPVGSPLTGGQYWRVCLNVTTEAGSVTPTENTWGQLIGTMMVITRCINPTTEPAGSGFTVWSQ